MKIEEAIKYLRMATDEPQSEKYSDMYKEMCSMSINALEKQMAKIPNYEGDGYYNGELVLDTWICPNCGNKYEVDYEEHDYCPKCGQHINHSTLTEDD